jgi:hypothetical protein
MTWEKDLKERIMKKITDARFFFKFMHITFDLVKGLSNESLCFKEKAHPKVLNELLAI